MKREVLNDLLIQLKHEAPYGLPREWFDNDAAMGETMSRSKNPKNVLPKDIDQGISVSSPEPLESSMSWEALHSAALGCRKCRLCETRNSVVFGDGDFVSPKLVFVGEGPGAEEDKRGLPFVGRAGELLTGAITKGMGLSRSEVYICNVVKCRPPENRQPLPDESAACTPYLFRQLELIKPKVIVTLGQQAQLALCGKDVGITKLRGTWLEWRGIKVMPTLHPAYLLRNPPAKKDFWIDLQLVMEELGLKQPKQSASSTVSEAMAG